MLNMELGYRPTMSNMKPWFVIVSSFRTVQRVKHAVSVPLLEPLYMPYIALKQGMVGRGNILPTFYTMATSALSFFIRKISTDARFGCNDTFENSGYFCISLEAKVFHVQE